MQTTEVWTIQKLLDWTTDFLKSKGSESPRLDAEVLLAHVRGCERIHLYTAFDEVASDEQRTGFRELVRKRSEGAPVAYLVGYREFFSLDFIVNENVLIPRPETEYLVTTILDIVKEHQLDNPTTSILDVGTGSGVIAVCLAKHLKNAKVFASDVCEKALSVAKQNAEKHGVSDQIEFRSSDLLQAFDGAKFDIIVSNPPYVALRDRPDISPTVKDFEPEIALFSGDDGLDAIRRLIKEIPSRINQNGWFVFEFSPEQCEPILQILGASHELGDATVIRDLAAKPRAIAIQRTGDS